MDGGEKGLDEGIRGVCNVEKWKLRLVIGEMEEENV